MQIWVLSINDEKGSKYKELRHEHIWCLSNSKKASGAGAERED